MSRLRQVSRWLNLSLLILYPVAWTAPLLRAGLLPLFGMTEISVLSGMLSLLDSDVFLALVVALFAFVAPLVKTLGLALVQFGLGGRRLLTAISILGKFAMADVFLIALYVTLAKGLGVGRVETAWGLYLFTACILASITVSQIEERTAPPAPPVQI